jgi:hypothetical protein
MVMRRRDILKAPVMLAPLSLAMGAIAHAADGPGDHAHDALHENCVKACGECIRECEMCTRHCGDLVADGRKAHLKTLRSCMDCAEICTTTGRVVARQGPMASLFMQACAKACDDCGGECESQPADEMMKRCAKACRVCAAACRASSAALERGGR